MKIKIVFSIFVLLFFDQTTQQVCSVDIISTLNVTEIYVGQPFTHRCELRNFVKNDHQYYLNFFLNDPNDSFYADYYFNSGFNLSFNSFIDETETFPFLKVTPLLHNGTLFEISLVTISIFSNNFVCKLFDGNDGKYVGESNHISVAIQTPHLEAKFSTNISVVQLNESFTATCSIISFNLVTAKKLLINFYNSRDGLLGSFKVQTSGESFLLAEQYPNVTVHHGLRSTLPTFDLLLTEKTNRRLSYWCELVDLSTSTRPKFESDHWKSLGPFVDFTSKLENDNGTYSGTCSIDSFDPTGKSYSVQFYSNLGALNLSGNLLGQYIVKPNEIGEFDALNDVPKWSLITNGGAVKWPNFEVLAKPEIESGLANRWSWWCVFAVEGNGTLYKSNLGKL